jgi:hypothetical protein
MKTFSQDNWTIHRTGRDSGFRYYLVKLNGVDQKEFTTKRAAMQFIEERVR